MEIVIDNKDSLEDISAAYNISEEKLELLRKRGFFPMSSGMIDDTYYNTQKEVKNYTHLQDKISIDRLINASYEEMKNTLFMKDSVMPQPVVRYADEKKWEESFAGSEKYYDVDPLLLEPYIAKYIRAINRCGVHTVYSCDGWHNKRQKSKEMVVLFNDRYSWIWHKVLLSIQDLNQYEFWEHEEKDYDFIARIRLPIDDNLKIHIYDEVSHLAETILNNCKLYKLLKEYICKNIDWWNIEYLTADEVESVFMKFIDDYIHNEI